MQRFPETMDWVTYQETVVRPILAITDRILSERGLSHNYTAEDLHEAIQQAKREFGIEFLPARVQS